MRHPGSRAPGRDESGLLIRCAYVAFVVCVLAPMIAACMDIKSVHCSGHGESWICPEGTICHDGQYCITQVQIDRCEGLPEMTPCEIPGVTPGSMVCRQGLCVTPFCGDGVIDEDELCDRWSVGEADCTDYGFYTGILMCTATCDGHDPAQCAQVCGALVHESTT